MNDARNFSYWTDMFGLYEHVFEPLKHDLIYLVIMYNLVSNTICMQNTTVNVLSTYFSVNTENSKFNTGNIPLHNLALYTN